MQKYTIPESGNFKRLHLNEFRFEHPLAVIEAQAAASKFNLAEYSNGPNAELRSKLVDYVGIPSDKYLVVSNGSDELLCAVTAVCRQLGIAKAIVGMPTYTHFEQFVIQSGLALISYQIGFNSASGTHMSILKYYSSELENGCLVYIGNPNNPMGHMCETAHLMDLADRFPRSIFVIDEAYIEFTSACRNILFDRQALNYNSSAFAAISRPNVIVARTLSKAFGLASLRIGYGVGHPSLLQHVNANLNAKAFNPISNLVASAVLSNLEFYRHRCIATYYDKQQVVDHLLMAGWDIVDSAGNFFLMYVGDVRRAMTIFQRAGILVRDRSRVPFLSGFVRISMGTTDDAIALIDAVKNLEKPRLPPIQSFYTDAAFVVILKTLARQAVVVFRQLEFQFFATAGTLLGIVRHQGIIPWDDDVDFAYITTIANCNKIAALKQAFEAENLTFQRNRTDAYWQIGLNNGTSVISAVHIDLFSYSMSTNHRYVSDDVRYQHEEPHSDHAECNTTFSVDELFPLKTGDFYDLKIPIPAKPEIVLSRALGVDFMSTAVVRASPSAIKYDLTDFSPA